ncbi:hypothetical protein [Polymorphospora rubra]|uniref:Uncharacterized protein n=1 Tax=Polymorphospora rubra TaxID=338584 RepID=A0A810MVT4_9ACTN|nr:hypothetical protein [Polymorphospora rubra]BCJ65132.1 hypothetical protein Prubr_21530 [Polymorphospora rubra]
MTSDHALDRLRRQHTRPALFERKKPRLLAEPKTKPKPKEPEQLALPFADLATLEEEAR